MAKPKKEDLRPIKKLANGSALLSNGWVRTPVARLSFVNFVTPKTNTGDDGSERESYGCATLFPKGTDLKLLTEACEKHAKAEKGDKWKRFAKTPLRKQDDKVGDYDGFVEGGWYMNNSSKYKPKATGRDKGDIELSAFYSGCYARLILRPYCFDNKGNKGTGLGIAGVQFIRDGEPLGGGGIDPNDVFDAEEGDDISDDDGAFELDDDDDSANEFL
jgi:hypothetical protein